jgi:hypothetical protein
VRAHSQYTLSSVSAVERRWNERIAAWRGSRRRSAVGETRCTPPWATGSAALLSLADDLPRLWEHPAASAETRKRILRAVIREIAVTVEPGCLRLMLH